MLLFHFCGQSCLQICLAEGLCHRNTSGDVVWLKGSAGDAEIRLGAFEDSEICITGQHISTRAGCWMRPALVEMCWPVLQISLFVSHSANKDMFAE